MKHLTTLAYLIVFYISVSLFIINLTEFTFAEKVIMATLISGFHCISGLISMVSGV